MERFFGRGDIVEAELWFYDRPIDPSLPPRVTLIFFRDAGIGELILYSPIDDGPEALLRLDTRVDMGEAVARLAIVLAPENAVWAGVATAGRAASIGVSLTLVDRSGRRLIRRETEHRLEPPAGTPEEVLGRPISIQDLIPLIPGSYQARWHVEDNTSGRFTLLEHPITAADGTKRAPVVAAVVLGSSRHESSEPIVEIAPFGLGSMRLDLLVQLADERGRVVTSRGAAFDIAPPVSLDRPGLTFRASMSVDDGIHLVSLGEQALAVSRFEDAEVYFRRALSVPELESPGARLGLGRSLLFRARAEEALGRSLLFRARAEEALDVLAPLHDAYRDDAMVVEALGVAHYMTGAFEASLPLLEKARASREFSSAIRS